MNVEEIKTNNKTWTIVQHGRIIYALKDLGPSHNHKKEIMEFWQGKWHHITDASGFPYRFLTRNGTLITQIEYLHLFTRLHPEYLL